MNCYRKYPDKGRTHYRRTVTGDLKIFRQHSVRDTHEKYSATQTWGHYKSPLHHVTSKTSETSWLVELRDAWGRNTGTLLVQHWLSLWRHTAEVLWWNIQMMEHQTCKTKSEITRSHTIRQVGQLIVWIVFPDRSHSHTTTLQNPSCYKYVHVSIEQWMEWALCSDSGWLS